MVSRRRPRPDPPPPANRGKSRPQRALVGQRSVWFDPSRAHFPRHRPPRGLRPPPLSPLAGHRAPWPARGPRSLRCDQGGGHERGWGVDHPHGARPEATRGEFDACIGAATPTAVFGRRGGQCRRRRAERWRLIPKTSSSRLGQCSAMTPDSAEGPHHRCVADKDRARAATNGRKHKHRIDRWRLSFAR